MTRNHAICFVDAVLGKLMAIDDDVPMVNVVVVCDVLRENADCVCGHRMVTYDYVCGHCWFFYLVRKVIDDGGVAVMVMETGVDVCVDLGGCVVPCHRDPRRLRRWSVDHPLGLT